jgi:hypothetical protein
VLVVAFNRPDLTAEVFSVIRRAKPNRFFFAVDGAHPGHAGERERVLAVRALKDSVDWPCEIRTLFRSKNLGCEVAVSQAISWFFDQVESGIILEDDCVPDPSFFPFTAELLERYKDDRRVALISGDNFQFGKERTRDSYYFSRYNHIWGWASWRRAWHLYDHRMRDWPALRARGWLSEFFQEPAAARYWTNIFDETHAERNSSWAYRWTFACWSNALLTALPSVPGPTDGLLHAGQMRCSRRCLVSTW